MSDISTRRLALNPLRSKPRPPQWESFPFLTRYYGGLRRLVPRARNVPEYPKSTKNDIPSSETAQPLHTRRGEALASSKPFDPYPEYASSKYLSDYLAVEDCIANTSLNVPIPPVRAYDGVPQGFPDAIMGSYGVLGLRDDVCFDRFGRLGPYGLGYGIRNGGVGAGLHGDREGIEAVWSDAGPMDFKGVRWGQLQEQCLIANSHRFQKEDNTPEEGKADGKRELGLGRRSTYSKRDVLNEPAGNSTNQASREASDKSNRLGKKLLPRTAFLIRTWHTYEYTQEDILFLRSLITELSLRSGGEFTIHLLVHVRDHNLQIWADKDVYKQVLHDALPEEFWDLGLLWTEQQMDLIYPGLEETNFRNLPVHGVYRSTFMPVQWFAHEHPEYHFFWQWEMDARYTGHYYHLVDKIVTWAKEQPRKGLWERNGRFYVPSVHGSWEDFRQMVRVQTEMGTNSPNNMWSPTKAGSPGRPGMAYKVEKPIWGPEKPLVESDYTPPEFDETPPTSYEQDDYKWGVGEEADLITLNPMFDPDGTTWILAEDVTGYDRSQGLPPRRSSTITLSRLSRRLLNTMHYETYMKRHTMFSEMWPASCALHHGYKAVFVPHPVYIDRDWPTTHLAAVFNGGRNGATGGARTSVFGDLEHNFLGTTWYYNAGFPGVLWRRWLGLRTNNDGGEEFELANEGRMCLPGLLLHPIKEVRLIIEGSYGNG